MTTKTAAVIYCRVSLDATGEGLAVERQEKACRQLAKQRGWTVTKVLVDNSISAYSGKDRPGFNELVSMIEAGTVSIVIAWALDRLTRSLTDLEKLIELAERNRATIVTTTGDLALDNDQGRMMARILASVARGEVERKSARQRAAGLQAAQQGRRTGGRRPFGYEDNGTTVRPAEAEAIRSGYQQLLAGVPLAEIARTWNRAGFSSGQTAHGCRKRCGSCSRCERAGGPSPWRWDSVRVVLSNPRNVAERWHRGELVGPAAWPAIIDEPTYRAAVALLKDPARMTGASNAKNLLTGIALCGVCNATVHAGGGRGRGTRTYRCSESTGHLARRGEPVDDYVSAVVCARLSRADAIELLVDRDRPDVDALRREAVAARSRLNSLAVEFAEGELTASQLRIATERLQSKLAKIEASMVDAGKIDMLGPLVQAEDVAATWSALGTARQRAVVDALMTVRILPPGRGVRTFNPATVECSPRA